MYHVVNNPHNVMYMICCCVLFINFFNSKYKFDGTVLVDYASDFLLTLYVALTHFVNFSVWQ